MDTLCRELSFNEFDGEMEKVDPVRVRELQISRCS